ncbi:MAG: Ig-like domain-containing protein [Planctomycetota bacterium]
MAAEKRPVDRAAGDRPRRRRDRSSRQKRRRHLLETLEARQLLAGPQLIGIQPNEGGLIDRDGTDNVLNVAPRVLTLRFDQDQQIDASTLDGIRITRSGGDGTFDPLDPNSGDLLVTPGLITVGDPNENEVLVRFAENLPDDDYRIEVFGFDDPDAPIPITGLRNLDGELHEVNGAVGQRTTTVDFRLDLGALIESVVPQPVLRDPESGEQYQNRNEITVYFNEDPLFVEDDAAGNPTERSVENPRFYQLLLTQDTVRTTDDEVFWPERVVYDETTHTARLFFATDINELPNVPVGGGTFRLRIGTAVDVGQTADLIITPTEINLGGTDPGDILGSAADVGVFNADTLQSLVVNESISPQTLELELPGSDSDPGHSRLLQHINPAFGADTTDGITEIAYNFQLSLDSLPSLSAQNQIEDVHRRRIREVLDLWAARLGVQFRETADEGITIALGEVNSASATTFFPEIEAEVFVDPAIDDPSAANVNAGIIFSNQADYGLQYGQDFTRKAAAGVGLLLGLQVAPDLAPNVLLSLNAINEEAVLRRPGAVVPSPSADPENPGYDDPSNPNYQQFNDEYPEFRGFLNDLIDPVELPPEVPRIEGISFFLPDGVDDFVLPNWEPVFPSPVDVLHGQHVHRPDGVDVDLYRFEIRLDDPDRVGQLSAETFAERLPDASELDTHVTLFQEDSAQAAFDFRVGPDLSVQFDAVESGASGNGVRIEFLESDRVAGDTAVRIIRPQEDNGLAATDRFIVDLPRRSANISTVPVGDVINAINGDAFASGLVLATLSVGAATTDISGRGLFNTPVVLAGGGLSAISRNDDYFSNDSFLTVSLGSGVYYIGVSSTGNESYNPGVPNSGFGGTTQGDYELRVKFEPQVDEDNTIRDLDLQDDRFGVPGTVLDGDGDGIAGGVHNFWFQTRPQNRLLRFDANGSAITPGDTVDIIGGTGVLRTYEFVTDQQLTDPSDSFPAPGNIPVIFNPGQGAGFATPPNILAASLATAINGRTAETGVRAQVASDTVTLFGERSVEFSETLRGLTAFGRTIYVDKLGGTQADGTLANPFNNVNNPAVPNAFEATLSGDIVRILGNGGADQDITTTVDNFSYQFGVSEVGGQTLTDGRNMEVPQGVTTVIDAGAILKFRSARVSVGSNDLQTDLSNGALQVLGTPRLLALSRTMDVVPGSVVTETIGEANPDDGGYDDGSVIFTSTRDRLANEDAAGTALPASPGDWGGLVFRRDVDQAEGRRDLEDEGIFLQRVNHAEIRYGGASDILVGSVQQVINPIQMVNLRPTVTFNEITLSADAAMSAAPNSFAETTFASPAFQQAGQFTADYGRVGPEIHNNRLLNNSLNAIFIRTVVSPVTPPSELTLAGRFDDVDLVHAIAENLVIAGRPGGSITDGFSPSLGLASGRDLDGGGLVPESRFVQYRMTFVDADGFESAVTLPADAFNVGLFDPNDLNDPNNPANPNVLADPLPKSVELIGLPTIGGGGDYVSRRIYRAISDEAGNPLSDFYLVADLDASSESFLDNGSDFLSLADIAATAADQLPTALDLTREGRRGRLDGSLVIDPGVNVKLQGARIELGVGTQLLAEGSEERPVVITSTLDDRYGAGGTFDTNNDVNTAEGNRDANRGDWSGIYASPNAHVSIDNAVVAYGGGISFIEGGETKGFAPVELHQASGRIANSVFEFNDDGQDGSGPEGRNGRLAIDPSVIFVRGSQPTIVANDFIDNRGSVVAIDVDSLTSDLITDLGRQRGPIDRFVDFDDNYGPLVRGNRYSVVPGDAPEDRQISGMDVRGGNLLIESIFDDTDIVHILRESVTVGNIQSSGGLRLRSRPGESLVVKLEGGGNPNDPSFGTGLTATGSAGDSVSRLGGVVQVLGLPGAPVVLTSLKDDTVGAGLAVDGSEFTDTNGDSFGSRPEPNDWRSILLDEYSRDRNVDVILEQESTTGESPGRNGSVNTAQFLGELATDRNGGDETRRLGFEVDGTLARDGDIDTYSFVGTAGSQVWIDVDETTFSLDTIIELLDADGNVLARSDSSLDEVDNGVPVTVLDSSLEGLVNPLQSSAEAYTDRNAFDQYDDVGSINPRDAGLRFVLPGNPNATDNRSVYYFRVRAASAVTDNARGGITSGNYQLQLRLQEDQEYPGSVVRYTDIRYANHGIHVRGLPGESPFLGEAGENEILGFGADNGTLDVDVLGNDFGIPLQRPQYVGNLLDLKAPVLSIAGETANGFDVDFYQFDIDPVTASPDGSSQFISTILDIDYAAGLTRPDTNLSIFYDADGEFGPGLPELVLFGGASNIADDLVSPGGESDLVERLSRGSFSTDDAFIGPVSLPEGTYYVAVTPDGVAPEQLTDILVRREPINSVQRLYDDRVEELGTSTASGPRFGRLFDEVAIVGGGFTETQQRGNEFGHGEYQNFDLSNNGLDTEVQTLYSELQFTGSIPTSPYSDVQFIGDAPTTPFGATDLNSLDWSIANNPQIGGTVDYTATTIPHISIEGGLFGDIADFYQIVVPNDGTRVIIDVDEGFNPFQGDEDEGDDDPPLFREDFNSVDVDLVIIDAGPAILNPPGRVLTSLPSEGELGSVAPTFVFDDDDLVGVSLDPFFDGFLDAGVYFIGVVEVDTAVTINNGVVQVSRTGDPTQGRYVLHVSQENQPLPEGQGNNESIFFSRNDEVDGELTSERFSLATYVAQDLPRFYFNYLWDSPADAVTLTVRSFDDPTPQVPNSVDTGFPVSFIGDETWRQQVVDLSPWAGHEGVQIEFEYQGSSVPSLGAEGLYLDDFIVGFAERGETVFNARPGGTDFTGFGFGPSGEYQLELRSGTEFATPTGSTQTLTRDFDTNDRHSQEVTLVIPDLSQISDGDTFVISDGKATQVFEFDSDGNSGFDRQRITFDPTETSVQLAQRVRDAINLSPRLDIEAASTAGQDTEDMTSNQINLFGAVSGSFQAFDSATDVPASTTPLSRDTDGNLLLPAVLPDTFGDTNFQRTQGQVLIENNTISDVRAIGIWSEPGERGVDPEDLRVDPIFGAEFGIGFGFGFGFDNSVFGLGSAAQQFPHPFLEQPPVGNPASGVARHLPVLNDSVEGGLTPGIVVRNNTVDQAGQAGIKIQGETRPFVIDSTSLFILPDQEATDLEEFLASIAALPDGYAMAIDAGGTRVVFEFEDVAGADPNVGGSGQVGGDGYVDGHVPIYYRHPLGGGYNDVPEDPQERDYGYNSFELMLAIQQAIQGSILVTNGSVELVEAKLGPSLNQRNGFFEQFARTPEAFPTAAVYLEGVSNIYFTLSYAKRAGFLSINEATVGELPVAEAPQPFARVVNNTIYGADGTESLFPEDASADGNDLLSDATLTHVGRSHTGPYIQTAAIDVANDVDFYQVELTVGDRLIVDIDTVAGGPDTVLQLFNDRGERQVLNLGQTGTTTVIEQGVAPGHLDPESTVKFPQPADTDDEAPPNVNGAGIVDDDDNARDPFFDFDVLETGTYTIAVSAAGNVGFDPNSLSGRTGAAGGLGDYQIGIEAYVPRQFVLSFDDEDERQVINNLGSRASDLIGATFTITMIPDFDGQSPDFPASGSPGVIQNGVPDTIGNQITFQFTDTINGIVVTDVNGDDNDEETPFRLVNIPLIADGLVDGGYRTPGIMQAIANVINGLQDPILQVDIPTIPNHENGNGPDGRTGPVTRARAAALGGVDGDNAGINNLSDPSRRPGFSRDTAPLHYLFQNETDFDFGFGHDRREDLDLSIRPDESLVIGFAQSSLYVLLENIAEIELSPQAIEAGLKVSSNDFRPNDPTRVDFADNADQLIPETGIWVTGGASPTILNNSLSNLHQSIVVDETSFTGFGQRVQVSGDTFVKPQDVIISGSAFQYDEGRNSEHRFDITWPIDPVEPFDVFDTSISTDAVVGATNVTLQQDDFNQFANPGDPFFADAAGNNFQPASGALLIDSAASSINERDAMRNLRESVGLPTSNVIAPVRDVFGVLRADNENFANPGGLGQSIFIDRGSVELADFIGPFAIATNPRDNDVAGQDVDATTGFIQRGGDPLREFQIQLVDTGDDSDPFTGIGLDDSTVVVAAIDGLRPSGANVTLFENDRLLEEGIDYTFSYDETTNLITLTPIAGLWRQDRSYRISINNRDRTVLAAPAPGQVSDGDQVRITDSDGGTVVFEYESGYQLLLPEPTTLVVPAVGTEAGGLGDGDIFQITPPGGSPVVFEFDSDGVNLDNSIDIPLSADRTPTDPEQRRVFLEQIASDIATAVANSGLPVDVRLDGDRVILGSPADLSIDTSGGGLQQDARTLALLLPTEGTGFNGVADGETFSISNGSDSATFEFDTDGVINTAGAISVFVGPNGTVLPTAQVAQRVVAAVAGAELGLTPTAVGNAVYLNLPTTGSASVSQGATRLVGLSRPITDGVTLRVAETPEAPAEAVEINAAYPELTLRDTFGPALDGQVVIIQSSTGEQVRIVLEATPEDLSITPGSRVLDITDTDTDDLGNPVVILASRAEVARRLALILSEEIPSAAPVAQDNLVFTNLPVGESINVQTDFAGIVRNPAAQFVVRETLEFDDSPVDAPTVGFGNIPVPFATTDTSDELAERVASVLNGLDLAGLGDFSERVAQGQVAVDANDDSNRIEISLEAGSPLEVKGTPGVTGASTIQVFGPLLLNMPILGGLSITDGSVLQIEDANGQNVIFQYTLPTSTETPVPGSIPIPYSTNDASDVLATTLADAINTEVVGVTATIVNGTSISLGRIDRSRVDNTGLPGFNAGGTPAITVQRGIVADGEVLRIRQGSVDISFEFESVDANNGVAQGNIPVPFESNSSPGEIAENLTAAIINNRGGLRFRTDEMGVEQLPVAQVVDGVATGAVILNDLPGTQIDTSLAPTLDVTGVPGGAFRIEISPAFSAEQVKQRFLDALDQVNIPGQEPTTTLSGEDRGGNTLFVENALIVEGAVQDYFLPGVRDLAGNLLEPNREDRTTQFTILLPTLGLDFGDAPDPVESVPGRYPSRLSDDGARHVVDSDFGEAISRVCINDLGSCAGPILGTSVDVEFDALSVVTADGDDLQLDGFVVPAAVGAALFAATVENGEIRVDINPVQLSNRVARDGDLITIETVTGSATLEFDTNGIFNEDNFAIRVPDVNNDGVITNDELTEAAIASGIVNALLESGLRVADVDIEEQGDDRVVIISGNDEDGVRFGTELNDVVVNPGGVFNPSVVTPIEVTVWGEGVVEAWIDFNADGDWDDPGELVISPRRDLLAPSAMLTDADLNRNALNATFAPLFDDEGRLVPRTQQFVLSVPDSAPAPRPDADPLTYARFRVSRNGGLSPSGLALSGEVEDYAVSLLAGLPPEVSDDAANRTYTVAEGGTLQANDTTGGLTPGSVSDDGLLVGVTDPDNDLVRVFDGDVGTRDLFADTNGDRVADVLAGQLTVTAEGGVTFRAEDDYSGEVTFVVRATDQRAGSPELQLVSSRAITVTIDVTPVNDPPQLLDAFDPADVVVVRNIVEDNVIDGDPDNTPAVVFTAGELLDQFFTPGPGEEPSQQELFFFSVSSDAGVPFRTTQGGSLAISTDGRTVLYTPPEDYNGSVPDSFRYQIADRVPEGSGLATIIAELASDNGNEVTGRVEIAISAFNDPPRLTPDSFDTTENDPLEIFVDGPVTVGMETFAGILDNDTAGPVDEAGQTIELKDGQFTRIGPGGQLINNRLTEQSGTVSLEGNILTYTPRMGFSGIDRFNYTVVDSLGAEASTVVTVDVGGVNDPPEFLGVNGQTDLNGPVDRVEFTERKQANEREVFDLTAWFRDPESQSLTFDVIATGGTSIVSPDVVGQQLIIDFVPFAFGDTSFSVTATDTSGASVTEVIDVTVIGTDDPPQVVGSFNPTVIAEDAVAIRDFSDLFFDADDPSGTSLTYSVDRLGSINNPTTADIANHPLVQSIEITGTTLRITPEPDAFGQVDIEVSAFDGTFPNSHTFTFRVLSAEDAPRGAEDAYNVSVGGTLSVDDPLLGLLGNDSDPDPNAVIRIAPGSVTAPTFGEVDLRQVDDGTFLYRNTVVLQDDPSTPENEGLVGKTDSFSYRVIDDTGRLSEPITVTLSFNQSAFQNPFDRFDVSADGIVSAVDALRIINLLNDPPAELDAGGLPVAALADGPPNYYDVSGDGQVSALDILRVINELNRRSVDGNDQPSSEPLMATSGGAVSAVSRTGTTQAFASASTFNLPQSNLVAPIEKGLSEPIASTRDGSVRGSASGEEVVDHLLSGMTVEAGDSVSTDSADALATLQGEQPEQVDQVAAVDQAIEFALDELFSGPILGD